MFKDNDFLPPIGSKVTLDRSILDRFKLNRPSEVSVKESSKTRLNEFVRNINLNLKNHTSLVLTGENRVPVGNKLGLTFAHQGYSVYRSSESDLKDMIFYASDSFDGDFSYRDRIQGVHVLIIDDFLSFAVSNPQNQLQSAVAHLISKRMDQPYSLNVITTSAMNLEAFKIETRQKYGASLDNTLKTALFMEV